MSTAVFAIAAVPVIVVSGLLVCLAFRPRVAKRTGYEGLKRPLHTTRTVLSASCDPNRKDFYEWLWKDL